MKVVEGGLDVEAFISFLNKKKEVLTKHCESKNAINEQIKHDLDEFMMKPEFQEMSDTDKLKLEQLYSKV